jgi:hypothetical protein
MARLKPLNAWRVNNEVLSVELFERFLRVTRGLEAPREGVEPSGKYKPLPPYFVLGGLQGLRTCEMVRERADYPVIEWRDFKWKKKLIVVRDEVAKQTRARDKLRYVPLEAASVKLLRSLAGDGPVIQIARRAFQSLRRELCREMRVRWPENCLRNSCSLGFNSKSPTNGTCPWNRRPLKWRGVTRALFANDVQLCL